MDNSLKAKVKIWVYFLRLCHQSNDPEIQRNLSKYKDLYEEWGNYQAGSYDLWWKQHSHLFRKRQSVARLSSGDDIDSKNFTISFPFIYAPTTATRIFKREYTKAFNDQRTDQKKTKRVYGGSYELNPNDFQVAQFQYYLKFCKDVYLPLMGRDIKPKLKDFVVAATEKFHEKTKQTSSRRIPFTNSTSSYEILRRVATRYRSYSYNLMLNASKGIFPGDYEENSIKNQVEKRRAEYPLRKFEKGVPRTKYTNFKKRESSYDMYATRKKPI